MKFKEKFTYEERYSESNRVLTKYPGKIPIVCEKEKNSKMVEIDKHKYLVSIDVSVAQFIYILRSRLKLPPEKAIFLFINGIIPTSSSLLIDYYIRYKDLDGFLYITYSSENVFGTNKLL